MSPIPNRDVFIVSVRFHVYVCVCVSALEATRLSQRCKYHHVPTMRQSFVSSFAIVLHDQHQILQCA